ncbi:MAG: MFS transporter [Bacillota bacterium]
MPPRPNSPTLPVRPPFFYGWVIVAVSALGIFFSGPGQTYSVSVFVDPLIEHFGWSRSLVSSLYSVGTLCAGLAMPLMGKAVDRFGHRRMLPLVAGGLAFALLFMSAVINPVMLLTGFALIRFLGQGSMTLVSSTLVPQWFRRMRGRAMSLAALGGAVSTAALPKINTWLIETWNWRITWQIWALLLVAIMLPVAWLLVRNRPEDVDLLPDNAPAPVDGLVAESDDEVSWSLAQAMRTRAFWIMLLCLAVPAVINTGLIFHQVSILGARGLSPAVSASVFSVAVMVQLPMNFVAGYVLDRVPARFAVTGILTGHVVLMTWILYTASPAMAIGMGVLRGLIGAFEGIVGGVLWPAYFGRRHLGSIRGVAMTAMVLASALGPMPFGIAYDLLGGYREIILLMMLLPALGAMAALLAPPPRQ